MADTRTIPADEVHALLRRAFAMRAAFYGQMLDVLTESSGREQAVALMSEAARRMGAAVGPAVAAKAEGDLGRLRDAFLGGIIEGEALFAPEVQRCDAGELAVHLARCPLKEAWMGEDRSDTDLRDLCIIAGAFDRGLFGAAGFTFAGDTCSPGSRAAARSGCGRAETQRRPERRRSWRSWASMDRVAVGSASSRFRPIGSPVSSQKP